MKKLGLILLAGVLAAFLLIGCGKTETKSGKESADIETTAEATTDIEYNTADNNTSEEVLDLETGANLRETPETNTEEEGVVPDDNEEPYYEEDSGVIPEDTQPVEEGGQP